MIYDTIYDTVYTSAEIRWNLSGNRSDFPTIFFFWKPRIKGTLCLETLKSTSSGKCWEISPSCISAVTLSGTLKSTSSGKCWEIFPDISGRFQTHCRHFPTLPDEIARQLRTVPDKIKGPKFFLKNGHFRTKMGPKNIKKWAF